MKIERIKIENFKGFRSSPWLELSSGFNIVVGQNNSGKSAFLSAFKLTRSGNDPFRSEAASEPHEIDPYSRILIDVEVTWPEWVEAVAVGGGETWIPNVSPQDMTGELHFEAIKTRLNRHTYEVEVTNGEYRPRQSPSHGIVVTGGGGSVNVKASQNNQELILIKSSASPNEGFVSMLSRLEPRRLVLMAAQRVGSGRSAINSDVYLTENASNLPSVLNSLRNNSPKLFKKLVSHVSEIFPEVRYITTPTLGNELEIRLWVSEDLSKLSQSISIADSGTGVAQAIAILYVAVFYPEAILVIDEINSFLHPMALKKLISILKAEYGHHQYVISTHATDVIAWSEPEKVFLAKKSGDQIELSVLNVGEVDGLRSLASELGVYMSDVFAADHIIWVEGETEERCFPSILTHRGVRLPRGTVITSVISTGSLSIDSRNVDMAYALYDKISKFAAPLVRSATFSFDREGLKPSEIDTLKKKTIGNLHILPRRMLENYLIDPKAISNLCNHMGFAASEMEVVQWITANAADRKFKAPTKWKGSVRDLSWLEYVDGAKLIKELVSELSGQMYTFSKTAHTPWMVDWMLSNNPGDVEGLCDYVVGIVPAELAGAQKLSA